ncbi:MAG: 16S rRNA (guanine(966)-N(2))-methyltransferase RsmD [Candidatus Electrothrix sp. AUS1_2]|nr:16S rRNA (guanine(966)-N(2))-methyltransferase RsmD [Candidatus Electrothrix sp. AUS1_2]
MTSPDYFWSCILFGKKRNNEPAKPADRPPSFLSRDIIMRITGGSAKGRHLTGPKAGWTFIRPTGDRVREALFNILGEEVVGSAVLDLYAGTGALGLEALSRGAETAVFVDHSRQALELIHGNVTKCFPAAKASLQLLNLSQESSLRRLKKKMPAGLLFDIVFLDPPYEKKLAEKTVAMVEKEALLKADGLVVAEERAGEQLAVRYGALTLEMHRSYGETDLWFYRNTASS